MHRRPSALLPLLLAALAALAACTFLTAFDPEGQPCDVGAPPGAQCLTDAGYFCVAGKCSKDAGP